MASLSVAHTKRKFKYGKELSPPPQLTKRKKSYVKRQVLIIPFRGEASSVRSTFGQYLA
jgi:hypothetical protein